MSFSRAIIEEEERPVKCKECGITRPRHTMYRTELKEAHVQGVGMIRKETFICKAHAFGKDF